MQMADTRRHPSPRLLQMCACLVYTFGRRRFRTEARAVCHPKSRVLSQEEREEAELAEMKKVPKSVLRNFSDFVFTEDCWSEVLNDSWGRTVVDQKAVHDSKVQR